MTEKPEDKKPETPKPPKAKAPKAASKAPKVAVKKILNRTKVEPDVYLKTPFHQQCLNEDGSIMTDSDGDPLAIPLVVAMPRSVAIKLIKKSETKIEVNEDDGEIVTAVRYEVATKDEIEAFHFENNKKLALRAEAIRQRKVKNAKHFVKLTPEEAGL